MKKECVVTESRVRRAFLLLALAALVAMVPLPAAGASGVDSPRQETASATPTPSAAPSTLGGVPCRLIPVPAAEPAPVGSGTCPGVRPGGKVRTEIGLCTLNFLFRAPDGSHFMGTAGHCIIGGIPEDSDRGEKVWPAGTGPVARGADGKRIGEFAYAVIHLPKDFALIRLDPGIDASPEMCYFGGPTGGFESDTSDPVMLEFYGNGVGTRDVLPARSGMAFGTPSPDYVWATGLALPGDSGSGVISSDGLAVGVLVTSGPPGFNFPENPEKGVDFGTFGTIGITRLGPQLARASERLGVPLSLVTGSRSNGAAPQPDESV